MLNVSSFLIQKLDICQAIPLPSLTFCQAMALHNVSYKGQASLCNVAFMIHYDMLLHTMMDISDIV